MVGRGALIGFTGVCCLIVGWLVHLRIRKVRLVVVCVMTVAGVFVVPVFKLV